MDKARRGWEMQLPRDAGNLWPWLLARYPSVVLDLLAHCVAQTVNAVRSPHQRATDPRLDWTNRLEDALQLDMADWWQPTAANFFNRVKCEQTLEAIVEATAAKDVVALSKLKKTELAAEADKRLANARWLPAIFNP